MDFFKNKIVKVIIIVLFAIAFLSVISQIGNNPVQRAAYTVMTPVFRVASGIVTPIRKISVYIENGKKYETEIESLKQQVNTLTAENKSREEYIKENKRLRELLDLKENMRSYETVTAQVVSYEPNSWYDTVVLDKGTDDGINEGDVAVTQSGVVGKVIKTGKNWSRVATIINTSSSVGVKLSRTGDIGVVTGDAQLAEKKNCRLDFLSNDKALISGDILVTSGLGGIYPPDLQVGKVTQINSDSAGNLEYGTVEPNVDFSSLYEVLVITNFEVSEESGDTE